MDKSFPTITLTSQQLHEIAAMPIGSSLCLEITVKLTGKREAEKWDLPTQEAAEGQMATNNIMIGNFEIIDVQPCEGAEYTQENVVADYEMDYAEKMTPTDDKHITININR